LSFARFASSYLDLRRHLDRRADQNQPEQEKPHLRADGRGRDELARPNDRTGEGDSRPEVGLRFAERARWVAGGVGHRQYDIRLSCRAGNAARYLDRLGGFPGLTAG
jgi:hypothetical protein